MARQTEQYLDKETLLNFEDVQSFQSGYKDSYSDTAILESLHKTKGLELLFFAALQTAIVGYGNKNFGEFKLKGQTYDVEEIYKEYGVKTDLQEGAKLEPSDLTPRRLQRFFRFQIQAFLEENVDVQPYLWKKYSTLDLAFRAISFPGAEWVVTTKAEAQYLVETYAELDRRNGTNISERIRRVLIARELSSLV